MRAGQHPNRRSLRLKGYDYAQAGAYFVTICTQGRVCLFGEVVDGEMRLNAAGAVVDAEWHGLPRRFPGVQTDAFVVMPNHVHGIIHVGARFIAPEFIAPEFVSSIQTGVADYDTGAMNRLHRVWCGTGRRMMSALADARTTLHPGFGADAAVGGRQRVVSSG